MDKTDLEILKILQRKARIPNVEVARSIGMAPSAILERIKKLEARGIIQGYEVRLDPEMFHCGITAFIRVDVSSPSKIRPAGQALCEIEQVQEVHYLAGSDSLMVKLKISGNTDLADIIQENIAHIDGIVKTHTSIAISTFKESAKIRLPDQI